jgi:RNA polymerase sigma factor (sigma-70 family)
MEPEYQMVSWPTHGDWPKGGLFLDGALREVLLRLRSGPDFEDAFRFLDARLRPRLLGYFRAHSFRPEDAEDLVQKTLARVFQGIGRLEAEEKFLPWLFAIARNVLRTAAGRPETKLSIQSLETAREISDPHSAVSPEEEKIESERQQALERAVEGLPARQRQCLALQIREELSYEEIAETLRLSVHTVRNHLAAARDNLRRQISLPAPQEEGKE